MTDTTDLIQRLRRHRGDYIEEMDEAADALEQQAADLAYVKAASVFNLMEENKRQAAQIEALRADAERYRWLRIQDWFDGPMAVVVNPKDAIRLGYDVPSRDRLDAAIDVHVAEVQGFIDSCVAAALRQEQPTKGEGA